MLLPRAQIVLPPNQDIKSPRNCTTQAPPGAEAAPVPCLSAEPRSPLVRFLIPGGLLLGLYLFSPKFVIFSSDCNLDCKIPVLWTASVRVQTNMSPSLLMDTSDDFVMPTPKAVQPLQRTLLLSPPSLSSHQEKLTGVLQSFDRSVTDLQMLDRLAIGLVSLPPSTYDLILILTDADGGRRESQGLLSRAILSVLVQALRDGGRLRSQGGQLGASEGAEKNEAILAGLSFEPGVGFVKPDTRGYDAVPLKLGRKKAQAAGGVSQSNGGQVSLPLNGKRKSVEEAPLPAGVGFDDGFDDSDDDLIDEDELMADEEARGPIKIRKFEDTTTWNWC